jgi:hypothetical protein
MLYTTYVVSTGKGDDLSLHYTANHGDMLEMVSNAVVSGYVVEVSASKSEDPHCTHPDYVDDDGVPNYLHRS